MLAAKDALLATRLLLAWQIQMDMALANVARAAAAAVVHPGSCMLVCSFWVMFWVGRWPTTARGDAAAAVAAAASRGWCSNHLYRTAAM
jgi:hypothetical protein